MPQEVMDIRETIRNADESARVAILTKNSEDIFDIGELKALLDPDPIKCVICKQLVLGGQKNNVD